VPTAEKAGICSKKRAKTIMGKIRYFFRCIFGMDYGRMLGIVRQIAKEHKKNPVAVFFDVVWCGLRYKAGYVDYQLFGFAGLPGKQRKTFVTRGINNEFIRRLNRKSDYEKLENKVAFNRLFGDYLGRDWVCLDDIIPAEFAGFLKEHRVIMAKPINSICGKGIEKITVPDGCDADALFKRLKDGGQVLVEECVVQHGDMARLYPGSVNTLRLVSVANKDGVRIVSRVLRMGSGGVVDNFNSGGLLTAADENGVVFTDAINENSEVFSVHPLTGITFKGIRVPCFKEAEELVKEAAGLIPNLRYVGWDVAFTEKGPLLIEANHNPGHQILQARAYLTDYKYGLLPLFKEIIGRV
jgi:hypothetical protein